MKRVLASLLLAATAQAGVQVAILPAPGPHGPAAREALSKALGARGFQVVEAGAVARAMRSPLLKKHPKALGQALLADVVLELKIQKKPRALSVRVISITGSEASQSVLIPVKDARFRVLNPRALTDLQAAAARAAAPPPPPAPSEEKAAEEKPRAAPPPEAPIAQAPPPEISATTPAPKTVPKAPPAAEGPPASTGAEASGGEETAEVEEHRKPEEEGPVLDIFAGSGFLRRQLNYTDDLFGVLDSYRLIAGLSFEGEATVFPVAHQGLGLLSQLGVLGRYNREPFLQSTDSLGDHIFTLSDAWELGPTYRYPLGASDLTATATYGRQRFALHHVGTNSPYVPGAFYTLFRLGVGARIHILSRLDLLADLSYLPVLSGGEIHSSNWFPRASIGCLQGRLGASVRVLDPFEIRGVVDYRRYYYSMNPQPGDPWIAGGALDQYLLVTLGLAARL